MPGKTDSSLDKTALRVLDTLDRWSDRLNGHHSQKRGQERKPFRNKMTVYLPGNEQESGGAEANTILETWPRNMSRSGAGFFCRKPIKADEVIVCLDFGEENPICFRSEIVRCRQVQEGLWEFGVKFLERVNL